MSKGFAFGRNWKQFLDNHLNDESIEEAVKDLAEFGGRENIEGKSFLDIGCGSGLHSLAAYKLKASSITSVDVDADSVACCEKVRETLAKDATDWSVSVMSILDPPDTSTRYDYVYSWGVLHHTGDLWKAIDHALSLVNDNGMFHIAIYNKSDAHIHGDGRIGNSRFWVAEKRFYAALPDFFQNIIDYTIMCLMFPFAWKKAINHKRLRGMSWRIDIKDWLGGYPYEPATVEEIVNYLRPRGFVLEKLRSSNGLWNNHYLFKKVESTS